MCVLLGNESEKVTVTKYILSSVPSVLPKFYEKMNKSPSQIKCQKCWLGCSDVWLSIMADFQYLNAVNYI